MFPSRSENTSISEHSVQKRLQSFLQGGGEGNRKEAVPYFVELDSKLDWIPLSQEAMRTSTAEDRNPTRRELTMHDRTYDPRPMRVRKTAMFSPHMDPKWLECVKETLETCQFSDPDPAHQLRELWETAPKPGKMSRRKKSK